MTHPYSPSFIQLDRSSPTPLHRQIYDALRLAILDGRLSSGARLPSTRELSTMLTVSRNTVLNAFDQLIAEGYLESRKGSGSFVTEALPDDLLQSFRTHKQQIPDEGKRKMSRRGQVLAQFYRPDQWRNDLRRLLPGSKPDLTRFPFHVWDKITRQQIKSLDSAEYHYSNNHGYRPLREAIATYLQVARAVRCSAEQVIITSGSQLGLYLSAQVLLNPRDKAWVEDPGYIGALGNVNMALGRSVPVPVDQQGLDVAAGVARAPDARAAFVTPSHQYPLGYTMSLSRRMALLNWASENDAWIVEDDYDSEYRYRGFPLASLQGLDTNQCVVYIGTFSKVLFPAMRMGYIVVPEDTLGAFLIARGLIDMHPPLLTQAVLTQFINAGHFVRHIRRMRSLYAARQKCLIDCVAANLSDFVTLEVVDGGMQMVGWLSPTVDLAKVRAYLVEKYQVTIESIVYKGEDVLVLGFTGLSAEQIEADVVLLRSAFEHCT